MESPTLKTMVQRYQEVLAKRRALEKEAEELKNGEEASLKAQIIQAMAEQNMQSVHYPDVGRIVRSAKSHYEVQDKELFAQACMRGMIAALQDGRPAIDGFLVQCRVSKDTFENWQATSGYSLADCGVALVEKPELSIRKS